MIRFSLSCDDGHAFEAWFGSNADFDDQKARGLVSCPVCGSGSVDKALMAPAVRSPKKMKDQSPVPVPAETPSVPMSAGGMAPEDVARVHAFVRHIRANSHNVGKNFAREARDMHDGLKPERPIVGEATPEEVRALIEDEVPVAPLPPLPEDQN